MSEITLTRGFVAIVDDADFDALVAAGPWTARPHGRTVYAQHYVRRADGRQTTQQLHVFLMGVRGIDHINGDGLDNRRSNLRVATHALNTANQRLRISNTSGFKGVSLLPESGRWMARCLVDGRRRSVGTFDTREDAAHAYDAAALIAWGDFARLNFPPIEEHAP